MKRSLLQMLRCPACGGAFSLHESCAEGESVTDGQLLCGACSAQYVVRNGIPNLIAKNGWGKSKAPEMQGWISMWTKKGMYDTDAYLPDSMKLPYVGGIWHDTARWFDIALEELHLTGSEVVLDLGAGQGWASRYFAERGCTAIAMDIVADEWYGLGRAWAIMQAADVYFEPVLGDGENMPFQPGLFDVVFLSSALHHFDSLGRVLRQIRRVLKPGGQIIAGPEPAISLFARERAVVATIEEAREGIVERRLKVPQFWWALRQAGFRNIRIDTFETYRASPVQVFTWVVSARQNLVDALRARYRPLAWLAFSVALSLPTRPAARFALTLNGGSLYVRATRPGSAPD